MEAIFPANRCLGRVSENLKICRRIVRAESGNRDFGAFDEREQADERRFKLVPEIFFDFALFGARRFQNIDEHLFLLNFCFLTEAIFPANRCLGRVSENDRTNTRRFRCQHIQSVREGKLDFQSDMQAGLCTKAQLKGIARHFPFPNPFR